MESTNDGDGFGIIHIRKLEAFRDSLCQCNLCSRAVQFNKSLSMRPLETASHIFCCMEEEPQLCLRLFYCMVKPSTYYSKWHRNSFWHYQFPVVSGQWSMSPHAGGWSKTWALQRSSHQQHLFLSSELNYGERWPHEQEVMGRLSSFKPTLN